MRYIFIFIIIISIGCNKQDPKNLNQLDVDIIINGSKDGGGWWFPQDIDCDPNIDHQGKATVDTLKSYGFSVYEIGKREFVDMNNFKVPSLLFIAGCYRSFSENEIQQILNYLNDGGNLLILLDHTPNNSLTHALNLDFQDINDAGAIIEYESHPISVGLESGLMVAGVSAITNIDEGISVIARFGESTFFDTNGNYIQDPDEINNPIFMGSKNYGKGKIVFCGDQNLWQKEFLLLKNTLKWFNLM